MQHAELAGDTLGMTARSVGENDASAGQRRECGRQRRRLAQWGEIDVVHEFEEGVRVDLVQLHKSGQRRSELVIVALLQVARVVQRHVEMLGDERAHAVIDLGEQITCGGIQRVVEIEDPYARVGETAPLDTRLILLEAQRGRRATPAASSAVAPGAHSLRALDLRRAPPTSVPTPWAVNSSSSTQCGTRPSMMTTASTPASTTSMQPSILGIMPPEIVPCLLYTSDAAD